MLTRKDFNADLYQFFPQDSDEETAHELIDDIFDSIGSCGECISRAEDNHCEIYESMVTEDDWYCADFSEEK